MAEQNPDQRVLLRIKAAAAQLDISTSQIYNLISRGELEAVRVGRALRVPVRAIEKIAAGETGGWRRKCD